VGIKFTGENTFLALSRLHAQHPTDSSWNAGLMAVSQHFPPFFPPGVIFAKMICTTFTEDNSSIYIFIQHH